MYSSRCSLPPPPCRFLFVMCNSCSKKPRRKRKKRGKRSHQARRHVSKRRRRRRRWQRAAKTLPLAVLLVAQLVSLHACIRTDNRWNKVPRESVCVCVCVCAIGYPTFNTSPHPTTHHFNTLPSLTPPLPDQAVGTMRIATTMHGMHLMMTMTTTSAATTTTTTMMLMCGPCAGTRW